MSVKSTDKPFLWIDASNCRDGGGITHLIETVPRLEKYWGLGKIKVYAGKNERLLLQQKVNAVQFPEIPELDEKLPTRLRWQRYHYPVLVENDQRSGIAFAPGGLLSARFADHITTVTMCRNMLPFEWREAFRYGLSKMLLRLILLRRGQARSFRNADAVIFLTRYAQQVITAKILLGTKSAIIPHGISDNFKHCPEPDRISGTPNRLLYISIIDVYKHQDKLVEAMTLLRSRGHGLTLDLIGGAYPPAQKHLDKTLKRKVHQHSRINILGKIRYQHLPERYRDADIFVYASSCENLPNILLEAMASGLPIACSDKGPMPEIARDAAIYFDPENPASIADAIEKLVRDPKLRLRCAQRAYELASQYSWDKCTQETAEFLLHTWEEKQRRLIDNKP